MLDGKSATARASVHSVTLNTVQRGMGGINNWNIHSVMRCCDNNCVVLIGCGLQHCLPRFPVKDRASLELVIFLIFSLPLISTNVSHLSSCPLLPSFALHLAIYLSVHLLFLSFPYPLHFPILPCFLPSF